MWDKINSVFDMENPLMRALGTAGDLILLNMVTLLCMLPLVTYGAALTARDDVLWHMIRGEESYIIRSFFRSFKRNLRQGTLMGILFLVPAVILALDVMIIRANPEMHATLFYVMLIMAAGFVLGTGIYAFALLSRYENTIAGTLKNAVVLTFAFFPRTLAMVFFVSGTVLAFTAFYQFLFPLILLLGTSFPGYLCALLYNQVFMKIDEKTEKGQEEEE